MKNKLNHIIKRAGFILALLTSSAMAQVTIPDFFNQVPTYLTAFDTNTLVAQGSLLEIYNDMGSGSELGLSGIGGVRINFRKPSTTPQASANTFFANVAMRYAGVGGVISGGEYGFGYSVVKWDTRISLVLNAGYDKQLENERGGNYIAPGIWLEKAASKIIPGIGIDVPVIIGKDGDVHLSSTPQFRVKLSIPF